MKYIKRALALAVALALALTLAPLISAVNWYTDLKVITPPQDLYVPRGESLTLSFELNVPDTVAEVTYQWLRGNQNIPIEGATTPTLHLNPGDLDYPQLSYRYSDRFGPDGSYAVRYACLITAYAKEENTSTPMVQLGFSEYVRVEGSLWSKLYCLTLEPFASALQMSLGDLFFFVGPFGLIYYPYFLILRYIENYKAMLSF